MNIKRSMLQPFSVSLFTREWIEIVDVSNNRSSWLVSLFTREWIEISASGDLPKIGGSLPLYEGVD